MSNLVVGFLELVPLIAVPAGGLAYLVVQYKKAEKTQDLSKQHMYRGFIILLSIILVFAIAYLAFELYDSIKYQSRYPSYSS